MFEIDQRYDNYHNTYDDDNRIGDRLIEFWHVFEVHSIPAGNQGERHEYRSDDCQKSHDVILLDLILLLQKVSELNGIFPEI